MYCRNVRKKKRSCALSLRERRHIIREVVKNPFVSAQNLSVDTATSSGTIVTAQTIRNILHSTTIYGRAARKKPFINDINRRKRLGFAKVYVNKPTKFWKNCIFSDESKIQHFRLRWETEHRTGKTEYSANRETWRRASNGLGLYVV